jgi:hypothetical protein
MKSRHYLIWNKVPAKVLSYESMDHITSQKLPAIWALWILGNVGWYSMKHNIYAMNRSALEGAQIPIL